MFSGLLNRLSLLGTIAAVRLSFWRARAVEGQRGLVVATWVEGSSGGCGQASTELRNLRPHLVGIPQLSGVQILLDLGLREREVDRLGLCCVSGSRGKRRWLKAFLVPLRVLGRRRRYGIFCGTEGCVVEDSRASDCGVVW